jgi:hypothetical protein
MENKGLVINLEEFNADLEIHIKVNKETLKSISGNLYKLTIHNTVEINAYDFIFQDNEDHVFKFNKNQLFSGINIITLFNSDAQPIAERLYFNYHGLNFGKIESPIVNVLKDSIAIKLPFKSVNTTNYKNFSISVLPSNTKSYKHHNTIISAQLLQPYLNNPIQNGGYYFQNIDKEKKIDLDLLLLTEGWSRYNWNTIFNNPPEYNYDFEAGISYKLNSNSDELSSYLVYPNLNTKTDILIFEGKKSVKKNGFFPLNNENLRIGKISNKNQLEKSELVAQFFPSKIPVFNSKFIPLTSLNSFQASNNRAFDESYNSEIKVQELEKVELTKKKEYTRIEKLKDRSLGVVIEFDEKKRRLYRTFGQFITTYGYHVNEVPHVIKTAFGDEYIIFEITSMQRNSIHASRVPLIYLDDVVLVDYTILNNYSMQNIDYVEVNKSGIGEGVKGGAGVIRIYNKPMSANSNYVSKTSYTSYKIPVTFNTPKDFYAPIYSSFNTKFFVDYGVVDWKTKFKVRDGFIEFKVLNTGQSIKLFLEGVRNNYELLSQELVID